MVWQMAYAIYCDRHDQVWQGNGGFMPSWASDLELAELYGPTEIGINFHKYVWWRRALLYLEAKAKSYKFETKK